MAATKTLGQLAYEADVAVRPNYDGGKPRPSWQHLDEHARWSWERNPTPRFNLAAQVALLGADSLLPPEKPARVTSRRGRALLADRRLAQRIQQGK